MPCYTVEPNTKNVTGMSILRKCGKCQKEYTDTVDSEFTRNLEDLSGLCNICLKKVPYYLPKTNTNIEYCSSCGAELSLSKMYIDGQVLCPVCITKSLYKLQMSKNNHKCPNCGYEL